MHEGCGGALGQRGSEVVKGALLVSSSYSAHGLDVGPRKLDAALACSDSVRRKRGCDMTACRTNYVYVFHTVDEGPNFFCGRHHDLTQKHVFERENRIRSIEVLKGVKGFDEVRKSGSEVLLLRIDDASLHVDGGLQCRRAIDSSGSCARGREGSSRPRKVAKVVVQTRLDQVNLDQKGFVV